MNSAVGKYDTYLEVDRRVNAGEIPKQGACLFWTMHGIEVLRERGIRAILQAGSAFWPRIRADQDDGRCNTHFGYKWSPAEPASMAAIAEGRLPEMHVWIGIPISGEIVDFTTKFWPDQAMELTGETWPGTPPPDIFWDTPNMLPGAWYTHSRDAALFALKAIMALYGLDRAKGMMGLE